MAEAHLDHPGDIRWFKGHGPAPVLGSCPHGGCKHFATATVAWGPSYERYELVACGSDDCAMRCRAWVDQHGRTVTPWLRIDLDREALERVRLATGPFTARFHGQLDPAVYAALSSAAATLGGPRACRTCDYGDDPSCGHDQRARRICSAPVGDFDCAVMPCLGACATPAGHLAARASEQIKEDG